MSPDPIQRGINLKPTKPLRFYLSGSGDVTMGTLDAETLTADMRALAFLPAHATEITTMAPGYPTGFRQTVEDAEGNE